MEFSRFSMSVTTSIIVLKSIATICESVRVCISLEEFSIPESSCTPTRYSSDMVDALVFTLSKLVIDVILETTAANPRIITGIRIISLILVLHLLFTIFPPL